MLRGFTMVVKYVQPIFAPTEDMMNRNLNSLKSFFDYYDAKGYKYECIFGGYAGTDDIWNTLYNYIVSRCNRLSTVLRFDRNYGKAYVVNTLTSKYLGNADYFLTADSDIIFKEDEPDIIERLIEGFNHARRVNINPALISLYQEVNNCQILELCYQNKYYYEGRYNMEMICHPNGDGGVAGGCLFIDANFWRSNRGYMVLGVYAGDDANLMRDAFMRGYKFLMSNSIRCIHPHETNPEYGTWKIQVCPKVQQLTNAVDEADIFWKNGNK
jgi:hypothetical protein